MDLLDGAPKSAAAEGPRAGHSQFRRVPHLGPFDVVCASFSCSHTQPVPDKVNRCRVWYTVSSDPEGNVPKALVNMASTKTPLIIANIADFIQQNPEVSTLCASICHVLCSQLVERIRRSMEDAFRDNLAKFGGKLTSSDGALSPSSPASGADDVVDDEGVSEAAWDADARDKALVQAMFERDAKHFGPLHFHGVVR